MPTNTECIVVEVIDDEHLTVWVRAALVIIAVLVAGVMVTAACLHPYDPDGQALRQETHRQLGLPPCTFYEKTGLPCPSCGFTTSFSLTMHADPVNALRANSAGAVLAVFCLLVIPWGIISAARGRYVWIASAERALINCLVCFVALMLVRWGIILALAWVK
jgi:hypothetical protein